MRNSYCIHSTRRPRQSTRIHAHTFSTTQIVLVSSMRDASHIDIYPTPAFSRKELAPDLELPPNLIMAPDPCTFSVEGVVFGATSTDVLFHLGREEISAPPRSGDRLRR